jgi:hypothetical protein
MDAKIIEFLRSEGLKDQTIGLTSGRRVQLSELLSNYKNEVSKRFQHRELIKNDTILECAEELEEARGNRTIADARNNAIITRVQEKLRDLIK